MPRSYEDTGVVRAQAKAVRSSARKARVVLEKIRGKRVADATAILTFSPRAVSRDIELVLRSAVSNAEANHGLAAEDLVVDTATADEGVTMKRWQPRARGRAMRIRKRTTHITVTVKPVEGATATATGTTRRRGATATPPAPVAAATTAPGAVAGGTASEDAPEAVTPASEATPTTEAEAVPTTEAGADDTVVAQTPSETSADAPAEGAENQAAEAPTEAASTDQPAEGDRATVENELDDTSSSDPEKNES